MAILESRSYDILRRTKKRLFQRPHRIEVEVYDEGGVNTYLNDGTNVLFCAHGDTVEASQANLAIEIDSWLDCAERNSFPAHCHDAFVNRVKAFYSAIAGVA